MEEQCELQDMVKEKEDKKVKKVHRIITDYFFRRMEWLNFLFYKKFGYRTPAKVKDQNETMDSDSDNFDEFDDYEMKYDEWDNGKQKR